MNTLTCYATVNVPASGAMYFEQSVIVSDGSTKTDSCGGSTGPRPSTVNGRVTVATKANVYVGGNIAYSAPGDDVLGLIAANEVIIAKYAPSVLSWRAASLAQGDQWHTYDGSGSHTSMLYIGQPDDAERRLRDDVRLPRVPVRRDAPAPAAALLPDPRGELGDVLLARGEAARNVTRAPAADPGGGAAGRL